ncbi:hypothetical protein RO575_02770 [Methylomonas sp. MO1]|uniref:hypothetical protein n=1 Tax=Methylomonas sp. MO1 TaxID=3073619 RepID=UPI0028A36B46|nr:hypothetical protein [Methylomonas sp. MO1]MDT4288470.1 hypothetical protein [Methylomonas sp. MO1]
MTRIIIIFIIFFNVTSCSSDSRFEPSVTRQSSDTRPAVTKSSKTLEPPETGEPAMHAIQNNRLQQVMQQINELVYAQLSSEINLGEQRELKTAEIARIANELAASEKSIVETLPSLNLKPDEQTTFLALADKLRMSAAHMQDLAGQNQLREIPATLDTITNTCISCHVLFRKSRSLLEKCKDPRYTC